MVRSGMSKDPDRSMIAVIRLWIFSRVERRRLSYAENDMPAAEGVYERLRRMAVEDPKEAKNLFLAIFDANSEDLADLLTRLRKPNEGRLRQVVANAVRTHSAKDRIVPELLRWRATETDEFTRRAIEGALADVEIGTVPEGGQTEQIT